MIHLALWILSVLFVVAVVMVVGWVAVAILSTVLRATIRGINALIDAVLQVVAGLIFCLVLVPPVWAWEKMRRWTGKESVR